MGTHETHNKRSQSSVTIFGWPIGDDPTPHQTLRGLKLARFRRGVEGTLCLSYVPVEAPGEGLRPKLAPLARAEGRGLTLGTAKLALLVGGDHTLC